MSIERILLEDMEKEALEDVIYGDDSDIVDQVLKSNNMDEEESDVYPGRKVQVLPEMDELELLDLHYSEEELEDIDDGLGDMEDDITEEDLQSDIQDYFYEEEDEDSYIAGEEDELYDLFNVMDTLLEEDEEYEEDWLGHEKESKY